MNRKQNTETKVKMIIAVPKEIKEDEYRVGLLPSGVEILKDLGCKVYVETGAGVGSGITDEEYISEGAIIVPNAESAYKEAELIIKVKEPVEREYNYLKKGQILYTYLHLAANAALADVLLKKEVIAIAYETVQEADKSLPLLIPMSEVSGRMAIHEGAKYLERVNGGRGILLGGVPGVEPGKVVILGGGYVGFNSAKMAVGAGASVTLLDKNLDRLRYLDDIFKGRVKTLMSNTHNIEKEIREADLVVGSVLIPGAKAPKLITRALLATMKKGSVIIDVCIDQGGCLETSRPTSHSNPVFIEDGIIHYCVANMPGAVARTSTFALTNATFPYVELIASLGFENAIKSSKALSLGVNIAYGKVTHPVVAQALNKPYTPLEIFPV